MEKMSALSEGEILMILVKRSRKGASEVAEALGVASETLSRAYQRQKLTDEMRVKAAKFFGVDESTFAGNNVTVLPTVQEESPNYQKSSPVVDEVASLRNDVRGLKDQIADMARELERRGEANADLLEIIKNLTKSDK